MSAGMSSWAAGPAGASVHHFRLGYPVSQRGWQGEGEVLLTENTDFFLCQTSYKKTSLIRKPKREVLMQIPALQKALFPQPSWQWEVTSTYVTPQELPCNFGNKVLCQFWALRFVESASFQPRLLGRALVSAVADDLFLSGVLQRALIFSVFKGEMCTWRYFKAISLKGYKNKINTWHRDSWSAWWIF